VFTSYIPLDLKFETPQAQCKFPDKTRFCRTPDGDAKHNAQY
jgi:hypothetical protein